MGRSRKRRAKHQRLDGENSKRSEFLTLVIIVATVFPVSFAVGYINGWGQYDLELTDVLDHNVRMERLPNGEIQLLYSCQRDSERGTHANIHTPGIAYDQRTGTVIPNVNANAIVASSGRSYVDPTPHKEVLKAVLGGASGGITLKALMAAQRAEAVSAKTFWALAEAKTRSVGRIIAAAFAAISGYSLGYSLAGAIDTACDSPRALSVVRQPSYWAHFLWRYAYIERAGRTFRSVEDCKDARLAELDSRMATSDFKPTTSDIAFLYNATNDLRCFAGMLNADDPNYDLKRTLSCAEVRRNVSEEVLINMDFCVILAASHS